MTIYEWLYTLISPFVSVHQSRVRRDIRRLISKANEPVVLLDVGARKSLYTIGANAKITLLDVPRTSEVQAILQLGFTESMLKRIQKQRSNIDAVVIEDMINSSLPSNYFDIVTCIEVIEHVPDAISFVTQLHRVLKPGGILYLTTPNGDFIKNEPPKYNPDHIRHYTRLELSSILATHFIAVSVEYGVKSSIWRHYGQFGFKWQRPFHTLRTMLANRISHIETARWGNQSERTAHLFAEAGKG